MPKRITLKQALKCTGCHPACDCREYRNQRMRDALIRLRKVFTPPLDIVIPREDVLEIIENGLEG